MDELLRKIAIEGWWVWAILLVVITIAYLARRRVGLAAFLRRWEPWDSASELEPLLSPAEELKHLDGPLAVTNKRILVRAKSRGYALSQGNLQYICNVDYSETWPFPGIVFGAVYTVLGGLAAAFSGGVLPLVILGAVIMLAGLAIMLSPLIMKPGALTITFTSGRPIIISGRWEESRLQSLIKAFYN